MIHLNAGNLWDRKYLDRVIELNEQYGDNVRVDALFGSIAHLTPTARSFDRIPFLDWGMLDHYVDKCLKNDIAIRYTLNTSCVGAMQDFKAQWDSKLRADVKELHAIGVKEWTIASPLLIQLVRELLPEDFIEVSTIAEVSAAHEATRFFALGANGVNISTSINRDPDAIDAISHTGLKVSILANEACLYKCAWRRECYNLSSHDSKRGDELFGSYPFANCNHVRMNNPIEWVKARMVMPSCMEKYDLDFNVNWFKIAYRTHPYEVAIPILEMYMRERDPENLLELWPTIAKLGSTEEPKDQCFIKSKEVAENYEALMAAGLSCSKRVCGSECSICHAIYDRAIA